MKKALTLTVLTILLYAGWKLLLPHRYQTIEPLSLQDVRRIFTRQTSWFSPFSVTGHPFILLPDDATGIHLATYQHWIAYSRYLRFHVPVETRDSYLNALVSNIRSNATMPIEGVSTNRITPRDQIERRPDINTCPFADRLPWFDVDAITNGITIELTGGFPHPKMYVDEDRDLFFYLETD